MRYRGDKERPAKFTGITVNSKILHSSYDIPVEELPGILNKLYDLLAAGFSDRFARKGKRTSTSDVAAEEERTKTYEDWRNKTDFTVQVKPKEPTVLWMDLECMPCKKEGAGSKHFRSQEVVRIVIETVLESQTNDEARHKAKLVYVTRGATCGMHLFFPRLIVSSEHELVSLWERVNTRLEKDYSTAVMIDTGCSAMPLPLSRRHCGVTRVNVGSSSTMADMEVTFSTIKKPELKDFARITNFHHLVADQLKQHNSPPTSQVSNAPSVKEKCRTSTDTTTTTIDEGDVADCVEKDMKALLDEEAVASTTDSSNDKINPTPELQCGKGEDDIFAPAEGSPPSMIELSSTLASDNANVCADSTNLQEDILSADSNGPSDTDTTLSGNAKPATAEFTSGVQQLEPPNIASGPEGRQVDDKTEPVDPPKNLEEALQMGSDEEMLAVPLSRSSSTSSSTSSWKRGLKQSDIRNICAKAMSNRRKRGRDDSSISFDGDHPAGKRKCAASIYSGRSAVSLQNNEDNQSSLCRGYEPAAGLSGGEQDTWGMDIDDTFTSDQGAPSTSDAAAMLNRSTRETNTAGHRRVVEPSNLPLYSPPQGLYVRDDAIPNDARLPIYVFHTTENTPRVDTIITKEAFRRSMNVGALGAGRLHVTDIEVVVSNFDAEYDFYTTMTDGSTPVEAFSNDTGRLRIKKGGSLNTSREGCPAPLFPNNVPHVLYSEDFVSEALWVSVLVRYYDEYLNTAPILHIMSYVLATDTRVKENLNGASRLAVKRVVDRCLERCKNKVIGDQRKMDRNNGCKVEDAPKQPYEDKCVVVMGLIAISSLAFKVVTPIFTDLEKVCRMMTCNNKQNLDTLNDSSLTSRPVGDNESFMHMYDEYSDAPLTEDDVLCSDSVSHAASDNEDEEYKGGGHCFAAPNGKANKILSANFNNDHSVLASILRWSYGALHGKTLWCLFFYYHHVRTDDLSRIKSEVPHGGLMVTALLQAYFELTAPKSRVRLPMVCRKMYWLYNKLTDPAAKQGEGDEEMDLMPPPTSRKMPQNNTRKSGPQKKTTQGLVAANNKDGGGAAAPTEGYKVRLEDLVNMVITFYFRPVLFEDGTYVYTERGYAEDKSEFENYYKTDGKIKTTAADMFHNFRKLYLMPHGELLLYQTDLVSPVNPNSFCTQNMPLNINENMYGGCVTRLTRHYRGRLPVLNRFNGDVFRAVVEARHAANKVKQNIELSYVGMIMRQPVVPPVFETDMCVRKMFLSEKEIMEGSFACLTNMDYVRAINMFTKHPRGSTENFEIVESFLNGIITGQVKRGATDYDVGGGGDARTDFRTVFLFYLVYIFEVLYKIRYTYKQDYTYDVSIERLSLELDVSMLLKLFFGAREYKIPRGLTSEALDKLDILPDTYAAMSAVQADNFLTDSGDNTTAGRCINTRPVVSTRLPNKMSRMQELFGKKGLSIIKSYTPLCGANDAGGGEQNTQDGGNVSATAAAAATIDDVVGVEEDAAGGGGFSLDTARENSSSGDASSYAEQDNAFLKMTANQLVEALHSREDWYKNCSVRVKASVRAKRKDGSKLSAAARKMEEMKVAIDATSLDTFLETQLREHINKDRLNHIDEAVRVFNRDFAFCTEMPLRCKMVALVMATHSIKRLTTKVAEDFVHKQYKLERSGVLRMSATNDRPREGGDQESHDDNPDETKQENLPEREWFKTWKRLLDGRKGLLVYCRKLADQEFPFRFFVGLEPENKYDMLYNYMLSNEDKYATMRTCKGNEWVKQICAALNYLLVMNAYDPELVELCLKLFLGFEWPGQWAKRIFVWKSNSNAGKSFFFEHVIRNAFEQSTTINDPKGGRDNAPEKTEYYKNFSLLINEFSAASASELKKLCSTSGFKFRMNFSNDMIQAFVVGKMIFNCNALPPTKDHATIQRVAVIPLPFWFQKRQTVVESMLNWTRNQSSSSDYDKGLRQNISALLLEDEQRVFKNHNETKRESELFNKPNENTHLADVAEQNAKASMFLVQNMTSHVYMKADPPISDIVAGIILITKYFCRFRYFNNIQEPVYYGKMPTACIVQSEEWERISLPYFAWKDHCKITRDTNMTTKISKIKESLQNYSKNFAKQTTYFDLLQFFECDFAEQKVEFYRNKEDEYKVSLEDPDG